MVDYTQSSEAPERKRNASETSVAFLATLRLARLFLLMVAVVSSAVDDQPKDHTKSLAIYYFPITDCRATQRNKKLKSFSLSVK